MEKESILVNKSTLASFLGCSISNLTEWERTRNFEECKEGEQYDLKKVCRHLYDWKNEVSTSEDEELSDLKKRKLKLEIRKQDIEVCKLTEELVPKEEYLEMEKERFLIVVDSLVELTKSIPAEYHLSPAQKADFKQRIRSIFSSVEKTFKENKKKYIQLINKALDK